MEYVARDQLAKQGFEVYLPLWVAAKPSPSGSDQVRSAMFPRYLFLRLRHQAQSVSPVRSTQGVSRLVQFGSEPALVNDELINDIRQMEATRSNDQDALEPFEKGCQVTVLDGAFKGVNAEVLSSDSQRVILLFHILGNAQQLEFDPSICQSI